MSTEKRKSALAVWDFRYNADTFNSVEEVRNLLSGIAKSYVFQLEEGDSGYRHYQGRLSLIKRRRKEEKYILLKLFKEKPPNYLEPTVLAETKGEAFYVMKDDTRLDGPYRDDDVIKVMTTQLTEFLTFEQYDWQKQIGDLCKIYDGRKIDLLYDPHGNIGKSILAEYLEYYDLGYELPPYRMMDDIFQWVCGIPPQKAYLVDMPRGMKKDKLGDFYSGLEVIKNGTAFDKRYKPKKIRFNRPRIFVFTNTLPCFKFMSPDRWNVWEIDEQKKLNIYTPIAQKTISKKCNIILQEEYNPLHSDEESDFTE